MSNKITYANGTSVWCISQGKRHHINGPALQCANGSKSWFINGKYHSLNGPANHYTNGNEEWLINDKPHRINGPATLHTNGSKFWFINGINYSQADFNKILKLSLKES